MNLFKRVRGSPSHQQKCEPEFPSQIYLDIHLDYAAGKCVMLP